MCLGVVTFLVLQPALSRQPWCWRRGANEFATPGWGHSWGHRPAQTLQDSVSAHGSEDTDCGQELADGGSHIPPPPPCRNHNVWKDSVFCDFVPSLEDHRRYFYSWQEESGVPPRPVESVPHSSPATTNKRTFPPSLGLVGNECYGQSVM